MRYFTVRASSVSVPNLLEVDVPANQLMPLFHRIENHLKAKGIFGEQEMLFKRLVPEYSLQSDNIQASMQSSSPDWNEYEYEVHVFNPKDVSVATPLTALSLWFYSHKTKRACSVTIPLKDVFSSAQTHLLNRLTELRRVTAKEDLIFSIFLCGQGALYVPPAHQSTTLTLVVSKPRLAENLETEKLDKAIVDILVQDRQKLVALQKRSWKDYSSVFEGILQRGDLRILIKRSFVDKIWRDVEAATSLPSENIKSELGGFLVGNAYEDDDGKAFVDISDGILDEQSENFSFMLRRYHHQVRDLTEKMEQKFPDQRRVGWFHGHLFQAGYAVPVENERGSSYTVSLTTSQFSSLDRELHRNLFPQPWQVALVIKTSTRKLQFYQWKRGEIEPCQGYYIYE